MDCQTSTALVHGIIGGIPIPFHIDEDDGCKSGISCPIHKQQQYNYVTNLPVKEAYPSVRSSSVFNSFEFPFNKLHSET